MIQGPYAKGHFPCLVKALMLFLIFYIFIVNYFLIILFLGTETLIIKRIYVKPT